MSKTVETLNVNELIEHVTKLEALVLDQGAKIETLMLVTQELHKRLETKPAKVEPKEMTKDDARRILDGDLKDKKHKDAAEALGLTYGQVYSCRLEFTFKDVHKALKNNGFKNAWVK